MPNHSGNGNLDTLLPLLVKNLSKFFGETQARRELAEAFEALHIEPSNRITRDTANQLAEFFVTKGGVYAFVGRAAKIRIATQLLDEITGEIARA